MASKLPPVKGQAYTFYMSLVSQADTDTFKAAPTLANGDVVVIKDGTLDGNIDALPVAVTSATKVLAVTLSADEMDADVVTAIFSDQSGDEWQDAEATIFTVAQTFDTTDGVADAIKAKTDNLPASPAAVGSLMGLANDAITSAKYDESTAFPVKSADSGATQIARVGAGGDTLETLSDQMDVLAVGAGPISHTFTINDGGGLPLDGVHISVSTDEAGHDVVASGDTNAAGQLTRLFDAGTYYVWCQLAGYNFTNPTTVTIE